MWEEVKIPVPWGHIAGKITGPKDGQPLLCLHGLQDNAGSFDRLIPILPKGFLYLAVDLPGHGMSSHFERGQPLVYLNYVFSIKLITDFYKWDKIILLAHSFGAQITALFAAIYPECCLKVIFLDGLVAAIVQNKNIVKHIRRYFKETQEVEEILSKKDPPSHTYEEALNRFINNRFSEITRESAEILIQRSLIKAGDGVRFSTDQRLKKTFRFPLNQEQLAAVILSIKCPCLLIIATDSYNLLLDRMDRDTNWYIKKLELAQAVPNFTLKIIEGKHDVHMDNAPLVAKNVVEFLLFNKSSL